MSKEFEEWREFAHQPSMEKAWEAGRALGRREVKGELKRAAEHIDNTVRYPSDAYEALTYTIEAIPEEG